MIRPQARQVTMFAVALGFLGSVAAAGQNDMDRFVTRSGDRLMEGDREYRFISFNIPNLHLVEDNMPFEATNEWRFPDEFEIADALSSVRRIGGRVARIYVLSIARKEGENPIPCHVRRPGEFNEDAFRALDKVLEVARRMGVRLIIPFVDNWKWWGGIAEYASYRDRPAEAFWTDREILEDFKKTVRFVIDRRNTRTGTLYKDDTAILAWETGNELYSPHGWTREIAEFIKSLDRNHLVLDGYYLGSREIQPESLEDPNIDIVSSHHYPGGSKSHAEMANDIARIHRQVAGKKAYLVGEFGFIPLGDVRKVLDTVIERKISGAMIWSLRFHNRDGGFYWHSEGSGGGLYRAYHDPGFESGEAYEERALLDLMRVKAAEISGLPSPKEPPPAPPALLPIPSVMEISWRGSAGASGYDIERADRPEGPWMIAGLDVDDARVPCRPLFSDDYVEPGRSYYYRVRARNSAGVSAPSNVAGPVRVDGHPLVDEMRDYSRVFARGGRLRLERGSARPYKEDDHRLKGSEGSWLVYRLPSPLRSAKVLAFMEGAGKDFDVHVSRDGVTFVKVEPDIRRFPTAVNPYGYKLPVRYELSGVPDGSLFLKITFQAAAQISRIELKHAP